MDPPDTDRIAYPLLVMVICELLGVPAEDRDRSTSRETWRQAQVPDAGADLTVDGYPRRLRLQEAAPVRPAPTRINVAGPGTVTGTKLRSSRV
jgi:hypothetical protein